MYIYIYIYIIMGVSGLLKLLEKLYIDYDDKILEELKKNYIDLYFDFNSLIYLLREYENDIL